MAGEMLARARMTVLILFSFLVDSVWTWRVVASAPEGGAVPVQIIGQAI